MSTSHPRQPGFTLTELLVAEPAMVGMLTAMHEAFGPKCEAAIRAALSQQPRK